MYWIGSRIMESSARDYESEDKSDHDVEEKHIVRKSSKFLQSR